MAKWWLLGFLLFGVAVFWPFFHQPVQGDMAIYTYIGDRMLDGATPYKDAWDIKSPGIFFQYALALLAFHRSEIGVLIVEFLFGMAACCAVFAAAKRFAGEAAGFLAGAALFGAYTAFAFRGWGCQPETPAMFLSAVLVYIGLGQGRLSTKESLTVGAITALLLWYKLPLAAFVLVLAPRIMDKEARPGLLRSVTLGLLPFLAICSAVVGYFWSKGALPEFWQGAFQMAAKIGTVYALPLVNRLVFLYSGPGAYDSSGGGLEMLSAWCWPLLVLAAVGMVSRADSPSKRVLWAFLLVSVLIVLWQGRFLRYHWLIVLPPLALFAGFGGAEVSRWGSKLVRLQSIRLSLIAAFLFVASYLGPYKLWANFIEAGGVQERYWAMVRSNYGADGQLLVAAAGPDMGRHIGSVTKPDDTLLAFDLDPQFNFYAGRRSPTRFIYLWPVEDKRFADPAWEPEFVRSVMNARPAFIIVCRANRRSSKWQVQPGGQAKLVPSDDLEKLKNWPVLGPWFTENYELVVADGPLEAYTLKSKSVNP
jgi:hypothetical protein